MNDARNTNPEDRTTKKEGRGRLVIWLALGLVAAVVILIGQYFLRQGGSSTEDAETYTELVASTCVDAVRGEFGGSDAVVSDESVEVVNGQKPDYIYRVTGNVEGTDEAGAAVSSAFTCDVNYDVGTGRFDANASLTE